MQTDGATKLNKFWCRLQFKVNQYCKTFSKIKITRSCTVLHIQCCCKATMWFMLRVRASKSNQYKQHIKPMKSISTKKINNHCFINCHAVFKTVSRIARPRLRGRQFRAATTSPYFWPIGGGAAARSAHAWIRQCQETLSMLHQWTVSKVVWISIGRTTYSPWNFHREYSFFVWLMWRSAKGHQWHQAYQAVEDGEW